MAKSSIGGQELALLTFIERQASVSVGEVYAQFGEPSGLARSTILTMMERLRAKRYLSRDLDNGMYRYQSVQGPGEAVRASIGQFVDKILGGSISPLVAWMAERGTVDDAELAALERLVSQLHHRQEE